MWRSRWSSGAALAVLLLPAARAEPIRLHPENPHYFLFRGKAAVLISSGEHYGAVLNADFDYHRYLASLAADGLNYTRLFGGSYIEAPAKSFGIRRNTLAPAPGRWIAPWARSTVEGYAGGGNKLDLEQWNADYFTRLRDFLSDAARRGIAVEITLFSSQYGETQWRLSPFNPANNVNGTDPIDWHKLNTLENGNILRFEERYVRKLVHEANGFDNVVFEIQNEPWSDRPALASVINPYLAPAARDQYPNSVDLADAASMTFEQRVADWIADEEAALPGKHLVAQNYCNFRFPVREVVRGAGILNFHYAYPEAVTLNYGLGKAIAYDETGFLGRDDAVYLRQAWNFMLAGGSAFDALDYSFTPGHEDGTDTEPNGPGGGSPALRRELGILSRFLAALPLTGMRPDSTTVKHAAGAVAHVLSNPAGDYAMYFDGSGPITVTLDLPAGAYGAEWTNVQTGRIDAREEFRHAGNDKTLRSPQFDSGIALRLNKTGR